MDKKRTPTRISSPWSKLVKKALIERDMTVTSLAKQMGYSRTYVSTIISGRLYCPEIANDIAKYLEIKANYDK